MLEESQTEAANGVENRKIKLGKILQNPFLQNPFLQNPMRVFLVLALFSLLASLPGLTTLPPLDRDEARFAQASVQMLETQDYINIRFQDQERNKKPGGIYWLQSASTALFSNAEARAIWTYRLPSVVGAMLAVIMTWRLGLLLFDRETAFIAAMMLAATPSLMGEASIAKTDAILLGVICINQFALAKLFMGFQNHAPPKWQWVIILWLSLGAAILLKGPIAPLIFLTTLSVFLIVPLHHSQNPMKQIINRFKNARRWAQTLKPIIGIIILIICITPWAIAIGISTQGRFFSQALGTDLLGKIGSVQEHHSGPLGYHLLLSPILLWSVAALLPLTVYTSFKKRHLPAVYFLLAWIVPAWIIFELSATKLPHYVLPLTPSIILLCAYCVKSAASQSFFNGEPSLSNNLPARRKTSLLRIGAALQLVVGIGVCAAFIILPSIFKSTGLGLSAILSTTIIFGLTLITALNYWREKLKWAYLGGIFCSLFGCAFFLNFITPSLDRLIISPALSAKLEKLERHPLKTHTIQPLPPLIISGYNEPSIVFLLGTQTKLSIDIEEVVEKLRTVPHQTVIIEDRYAKAFHTYAMNENLLLKNLGKRSNIIDFQEFKRKHRSLK